MESCALQASAYQMGVLLMYNGATEHSYASIKSATNIDDDHLKYG